MTPLLEVVDATVRFGPTTPLARVSVEVEAGTAVGLVGPNGAGKSTLLDLVSGLVPLAGGSVRLGGVDISTLAPHRRARIGLARTFQSLELFEDLSAGENVQVAGGGPDAGPDVLPGAMSHGERKDLALARALATRPRVLLLDEPAAGLDDAGRSALVARLRALVHEDGLAVLVAEHDLDLVLGLCDRVWVLDFGRVIAHGAPSEVRDDPAVAAAYLGLDGGRAGAPPGPPEAEGRAVAPPAPPGEVVLHARGLEAGYGAGPVVRGLDLDVRAGEVVALLGPNGAGKTTTLRALAGVLPSTGGVVTVLGVHLEARPHRLARRGLAFVPQDRAVLPSLTVAENLRLSSRLPSAVDGALARVPSLVPLLDRRAGRLSGGEQQLLAVARALAARPRLLLVDEVSMGLAPVAARQVLDAARAVAQGGAGVVLAEQHPGLALAVADRAVVLLRGKPVFEGPAAELRARPDLLRAAYLGAL